MESGSALRPCPGCGLAAVVPVDGLDHPCGSCGAPMAVEPPSEPEVPALATALRFPFSSYGAVMFLGTVAPLWTMIRAAAASLFAGAGEEYLGQGGRLLGFMILALFGGYIAFWLWDVLEETAQGSDAPPAMPWPGDYGAFLKAFFRFVLALAAAFGPALALRWAWGPDPAWVGAVIALLAVAGMVYYPMAMLMAGFSGSWTGAFRVPTAVRAIHGLGRDYALCVVLVGASLGFTAGLERLVWLVWSRIGPGAGLGALVFAGFLELAVYAIHMRAIGLVFRAHRTELGWTVRPDPRPGGRSTSTSAA